MGAGPEGHAPLVELPQKFLDWQLKHRIANLNFFRSKKGEPDFAVHIGYMVTFNPQGLFPTNVAAKGMGLLPVDLSGWLERCSALIEKGLKEGDKETREERLQLLLSFYEDSQIDPRVLTTIELYGKQTYSNLLQDPRCAVLFSSYQSTSFMVNGVVEILGPETLEYEYTVTVHDLFHLPRKEREQGPPAVYRIWVSEVYDKTPGKEAGRRIA